MCLMKSEECWVSRYEYRAKEGDNMSTVSAGIIALIMFGLGLYIGNMVQVND